MATVKRVPIGEAKPSLGSLCREVEMEGIEVILTKHGRDIVRITPVLPAAEQVQDRSGFLRGMVVNATDDLIDTSEAWRGVTHDRDNF